MTVSVLHMLRHEGLFTGPVTGFCFSKRDLSHRNSFKCCLPIGATSRRRRREIEPAITEASQAKAIAWANDAEPSFFQDIWQQDQASTSKPSQAQAVLEKQPPAPKRLKINQDLALVGVGRFLRLKLLRTILQSRHASQPQSLYSRAAMFV